MAHTNPRVASLMDGLLAGRPPVMAPADQTARPASPASGITHGVRALLRKLSEWDTQAGRGIAERLPAGVSLQLGALPDWISGPKGAAKKARDILEVGSAEGRLLRAGPFDAAHQLEMGKLRGAELLPHEPPDLLPAFLREPRNK